eukprot:CCRYP_019808-RA/>CCRYP_019808-RA protein AED:0.39 eAED:0.39 QI:0/0/0/1/1/1/2/0/114
MPLVTSSTGKVLPGQASTLRFCLTLQTAIERNSIRFPQNQLLLLQCNTFREEQYETGEKAQQKLDEQLNHESGDRRLDGKDLLPLLEGYKMWQGWCGIETTSIENGRRWKAFSR